MHTALAPPDPLPVAEVSIARLHGIACWHCGAVNASLAPLGTVTTRGADGVRTWPVVGCTSHTTANGRDGVPR